MEKWFAKHLITNKKFKFIEDVVGDNFRIQTNFMQNLMYFSASPYFLAHGTFAL